MKVGLIGFGTGGAAFHAPLIEATDGLELSAVVTANPERAATARATYPSAAVLPHVSALWDAGLDAVTITTPNDTHASLAREALDHGLHVVVDKPMATRVADAEALVAHAAACDRLLTVYLNRRWDGDFRTVRDLVARNRLGQVHRFESRFERWRPQVVPSWKESSNDGGGILFDLGPHLIDQALQLFGPVIQVHAEVGCVREGAINPDDVFLALNHASGVQSHLWLSAVAADQGPRFRVLGDAGAYRVFGMDPQEAALRAGVSPNDDPQTWGAAPDSTWGVVLGGNEPVVHPTMPGDYPEFYRRWATALRGDGPVPVDPADAIEGLRIIESALSG